MTFWGWVFFILIAGGFIYLLSEIALCALHIDHWSDLWRSNRP